jgi:thiamine-monophosphate kinase
VSTEERRIRAIVDLWRSVPTPSCAGLEATGGLAALDDCAVIPLDNQRDLVIGTDFVRGEGFHLFQRGYLTWRDVGYYLAAANASDLAAMGAAPIGIVVVCRYTANMSDGDFHDAMEGVIVAARDFAMPLLGGDSGGYEKSVLSAAAIGIVPHGRALLRGNGKHGDVLYVTGTVGQAGAALAYFTRGITEGVRLDAEQEELLLESWRRPEPALAQGQFLVEYELSRCAIDTSDGLKSACRQLAEASGLAAILHPNLIPVAPVAASVANVLRVDALALSLGDSVDFRLLFSVTADGATAVENAFAAHGWPLFRIGEFRHIRRVGAFFEDENGLREVPGVEWDQRTTLAIDDLRIGRNVQNE